MSVLSGRVLAGWGYARVRRVVGMVEPVRPRRSRCRSCGVTHVLLPVTLLLRRAYAAEVIWEALAAKAAGAGHRQIAARLGCGVHGARMVAGHRGPGRGGAALVRGDRAHCGVDVSIPKSTGSGCGDVLAAISVAAEAITARFGPASVLGAVTAVAVAVAAAAGGCSVRGGRRRRAAR